MPFWGPNSRIVAVAPHGGIGKLKRSGVKDFRGIPPSGGRLRDGHLAKMLPTVARTEAFGARDDLQLVKREVRLLNTKLIST